MIKIQQLCAQLVDLIGEETLNHELEGILKKHQGIAHRTRKPGRIDRCLTDIRGCITEGTCLTPRMIATVILPYNLSPASMYRLMGVLRRQGLEFRAVDVLREQERMKSGVY
jgi:hypothetical protein